MRCETVLISNRMGAKRLARSCTREVQTKKKGIFSLEKQKESITKTDETCPFWLKARQKASKPVKNDNCPRQQKQPMLPSDR